MPNSLITKMIMGPKSIFCCWSKKYQFEEIISFKDMTVEGMWKNGNQKG